MSAQERMLDQHRDAAQQAVTAAIHRDRTTASEIIQGVDGTLVALVLVDLVAYVHHRWAVATGVPEAQAWAELMTDIEEWRIGGIPR